MSSEWPLSKFANNFGVHPGILGVDDGDALWTTIGEQGDAIQFGDAEGVDWQSLGFGLAHTVAYRLDHQGVLHFRGACHKADAPTGAFGSLLFVMPAGLRLSGLKLFQWSGVWTAIETDTPFLREVQLQMWGDAWGGGFAGKLFVRFQSQQVVLPDSVQWFALDGLRYLVEA